MDDAGWRSGRPETLSLLAVSGIFYADFMADVAEENPPRLTVERERTEKDSPHKLATNHPLPMVPPFGYSLRCIFGCF